MNIKFTHEASRAALSAVPRALREELALLTVLALQGDLLLSYDTKLSKIAELAGISTAAAEAAIQFWRGAGVLTFTEEQPSAQSTPALFGTVAAPADAKPADSSSAANTEPSSAAKPALQSDTSYTYTGKELEALLNENGSSLRRLIEECQNIAEKLFNPLEINKIVYLADGLGLEQEHILLLFAYCKQNGKTAVPYVEKTAINLYNEGVDTLQKLESYIREKERAASFEGKIRTLFGIGERTFTKNEKKYFQTWRNEWDISPELAAHAYQICVDNRGSLSMPYIHRILQNWHEAGITTVEAANAAHEAFTKSGGASTHRAKESTPASQTGGSFETEEFIELALKRSREAAGKVKSKKNA